MIIVVSKGGVNISTETCAAVPGCVSKRHDASGGEWPLCDIIGGDASASKSCCTNVGDNGLARLGYFEIDGKFACQCQY